MPRLKHLTPSSFDKLMTAYRASAPDVFGKTAFSVIDRYTWELLGFDQEEEPPAGGARGWGIDNEWLALNTYQERYYCEVRKARFTRAKSLSYVGGTIDGLVGKEGGVEAKCPKNPENHFDRVGQYCRYKFQLHGYMWVFNLEWIDFISFDPRFPEDLRLIVDRIERDGDIIKRLEDRCKAAHKIAMEKAASIRSRFGVSGTGDSIIPF